MDKSVLRFYLYCLNKCPSVSWVAWLEPSRVAAHEHSLEYGCRNSIRIKVSVSWATIGKYTLYSVPSGGIKKYLG